MKGSFDKLQEFKWRGIAVPLSEVSFSFSQDLVQHKYPDRDGAHVESTGRSPIVVNAKIVFYNNTSAGKGASLQYGTLFPTVFTQFLDACKDTSPGVLEHPVHGSFDAKVQSYSYTLNPNNRDGAIVDVSFIETIKNELIAQVPVVEIKSTVQALRDELAISDSNHPVNKLLPPDDKLSLLEALDSIKGFIDGVALAGKKFSGLINRVTSRLNKIVESARAANDVLLTPFISAAQTLSANLEAKKNQEDDSRSVRLYVTKEPTTLAALTSLLNNDIKTLIELNKNLVKPIIPEKSLVRYRKS